MIEAWEIAFRGYLERTENKKLSILDSVSDHPLASVFKAAFESGVEFAKLIQEIK